MNKQPPFVACVGWATERLVLYLFIASLSFLPRLMFAKTPNCPCNPCRCGACTCGGGGGSKSTSGKTDSKHHEHKGEKGHGPGHGGVGISTTIDLGSIGHREPDKADPFAVPGGGSTTTIRHAKTTEKIKKVAKRKEVGKTDHVTDPNIDLTQDITADDRLPDAKVPVLGSDRDSFFTELYFPIITSTMNVPFVRSIDLTLAWRYEKFDHDLALADFHFRDPPPAINPVDGNNGQLFILPGGPFSLPDIAPPSLPPAQPPVPALTPDQQVM